MRNVLILSCLIAGTSLLDAYAYQPGWGEGMRDGTTYTFAWVDSDGGYHYDAIPFVFNYGMNFPSVFPQFSQLHSTAAGVTEMYIFNDSGTAYITQLNLNPGASQNAYVPDPSSSVNPSVIQTHSLSDWMQWFVKGLGLGFTLGMGAVVLGIIYRGMRDGLNVAT